MEEITNDENTKLETCPTQDEMLLICFREKHIAQTMKTIKQQLVITVIDKWPLNFTFRCIQFYTYWQLGEFNVFSNTQEAPGLELYTINTDLKSFLDTFP